MPSADPAKDRLSPAEVDALYRGFSKADWKRAFNLARLRAAGLPGWPPETLLAEALAQLQSSQRVYRPGVHPLVALKTVMRSIASNLRKKETKGPIDHAVAVDAIGGPSEEKASLVVLPRDDTTPEGIVDGRSQLEYIERLLAGDEDAQMVLMAWADDLRGKAAAEELDFDEKRYDAARKRLMTKLAPVAALRKGK